MKRIIPLLLVLACPSLTWGGEDAPPALLEAIAIQESGKNPFVINVAGKDHYPASREDALLIIRQAQAAGKSYDVGLFQINSWWIDRYGLAPEILLDPAINLQWGLFILSQEIARHGLNWKAVGKYHSPDRERGRRYAWKIYRHYMSMADHKETDNEGMLPKLLPYVKKGGCVAIAVPGFIQDYSPGNLPEEVRPYWGPDWHFYSRNWWRTLWEKEAGIALTECREMDSCKQAWDDWLKSPNPYAQQDIKMMEAGVGKYFNIIQMIGRKNLSLHTV